MTRDSYSYTPLVKSCFGTHFRGDKKISYLLKIVTYSLLLLYDHLPVNPQSLSQISVSQSIKKFLWVNECSPSVSHFVACYSLLSYVVFTDLLLSNSSNALLNEPCKKNSLLGGDQECSKLKEERYVLHGFIMF